MRASDWDQRYATAEYVWRTEPNQFLPPEVAGLPTGRALDLAAGEGRNAVWLASQGWQVTGVDFSHAGIAKGARLAVDQGVTVEWRCADVTTWTPSPVFDLVVVFYLQLAAGERRAAFERAARALAPGGTLLIVGHASVNLTEGVGGPQDPSVLYSPDEVAADLEGAGIVGLVIDRAAHVRRRVETPNGDRDAIDCLVRAHRTTEETP
jgi:SAM-dependent methyltransferase